ncbi:hypothetical protein GCM10027343_36090 [Noviherbaspirillum agri]
MRHLLCMIVNTCSLVIVLAACGENRETTAYLAAARAQLADADPARGSAAIARHGCVSCHTIPGIGGPGSNVGPPLDRIATRAYIGGVLPNTPEAMVQWLRNPPAVDPRTAMPNMNIAEPEARDIAAYLYTLE